MDIEEVDEQRSSACFKEEQRSLKGKKTNKTVESDRGKNNLVAHTEMSQVDGSLLRVSTIKPSRTDRPRPYTKQTDKSCYFWWNDSGMDVL